MMAAIANGGSADDIAPGVEFFTELKEAGNFLTVDPDSTTVEQGRPGRHRLGLPRRSRRGQSRHLEDRRPGGGRRRGLLLPGHQRRRPAPRRRAPVAGVPLQRRGPEPVARRAAPGPSAVTRWPRPAPSTRSCGAPCPRWRGEPVIPTDEQTVTAGEYLAANWSKASAELDRPQRPAPGRRSPSARPPAAAVPVFVPVFLLVPTLTVVVGAFQDEDGRLHPRQPRRADQRRGAHGPEGS